MGSRPVTVLDLFSGAGGLSLGVKLALPVSRCLLYVEIEAYACAILAARMEDGSLDSAPIWSDVRTVPTDLYRDRIDLVVGGFPCTDISNAGKRAGIEGEHSGLWTEYARIVREIRPRFVFVENVAALLVRGLDTVLGDLAALGFDAEWGCFSAAEVGAPHRRERLFILAHAERWGRSGGEPFLGRVSSPSRDEWRQQADGLTRYGPALGHAPGSGRQDGAAASGSQGRLAGAGVAVGHPERPSRALGSSLARDDGAQRPAAERAGRALADASGGSRAWESPYEGQPTLRSRSVTERHCIFPPGPGDLSAWRAMPAELQPAIASAKGKLKLNPEFVTALMGLPYGWTSMPVLPRQAGAQDRDETGEAGDGIPVSLHPPQILRSNVHGTLDSQGDADALGLPRASAEVPQGSVRSVRDNGAAQHPSPRSGLGEQRADQSEDLMRLVSHVAASRARGHRAEGERAALQFVRSYPEAVGLRDMSDANSESEAARGVVDGILLHLTHMSRVDRLRALGNAVVPAQAAVAFVELSRRLGVEW